jgi:hypothetical protein
MTYFNISVTRLETATDRKTNCSRVPRPSSSERLIPRRAGARIAIAIKAAPSAASTYSSLPKSVTIRSHHSEGVPRLGIWAISQASIANISTMIAAPRPAESHSTCRAARRAASARRECVGERTSCFSDSHASTAKREA